MEQIYLRYLLFPLLMIVVFVMDPSTQLFMLQISAERGNHRKVHVLIYKREKIQVFYVMTAPVSDVRKVNNVHYQNVIQSIIIIIVMHRQVWMTLLLKNFIVFGMQELMMV